MNVSIREHQKPITEISKVLSITVLDLVSFLEDYLNETLTEENTEKGEYLFNGEWEIIEFPFLLTQLPKIIIEEFKKENSVSSHSIKNLVSLIRIRIEV